MLRRILALATVVLLVLMLALPGAGLAQKKRKAYIIPDSNTRYLTYDELWQWDYESIGFIFNEIFARHGYNFIPGEKYDNFFRTRPWYVPNENPNNSEACYPKLSAVEWANERLCKDVRAEMRRRGTTNPDGKNYLDYVERGNMDLLSGFRLVKLKAGQKLPVYAAPSENSWRGAKGKAAVSTNGSVYAAGWVDGWLLVMYETNNDAVRVGYIHDFKGNPDVPTFRLEYRETEILAACTLTDDPNTFSTDLKSFYPGDTVVYLSCFQNMNGSFAYVETTLDGKKLRGFVPVEAIAVYENEDEGENEK